MSVSVILGLTIIPGPFSLGIFIVPSSAQLIDLELDISTITNNCTLQLSFQVSYDGGVTFVEWCSATTQIINGTVNGDDGPTGILPFVVGFDSLQPMDNRQVKVNGIISGGSLIVLSSTLTL